MSLARYPPGSLHRCKLLESRVFQLVPAHFLAALVLCLKARALQLPRSSQSVGLPRKSRKRTKAKALTYDEAVYE